MRHPLLFISTFLFSTSLLAQRDSKPTKSPWEDKTFVSVKLRDRIKRSKIVLLDIGEKATIYLSLKSILKDIKRPKSDNIKRIKFFLDSASLTSDTIRVDDLDFEYLVSYQLINGNAKVYYKKEKVFVTTISHRLEKYGMYAHRFFYLPDNRPFFSTMEYSGILEKGKYFSDPGEIGELYKKISSQRKE